MIKKLKLKIKTAKFCIFGVLALVLVNNLLLDYMNSILIQQVKRTTSEVGETGPLKKMQLEVDFNVEEDSIVFLHIQKTSGTFWIRNMIKYLLINLKKWKEICFRVSDDFECEFENAISQHSAVLWQLNELFGCDIHANYVELLKCVQKDSHQRRKFHFVTILRNPQERYISEFEHVKRGATWSNSIKQCLEEPIYKKNCHLGFSDWSHVTWVEFLKCEHNLANNRQVRMLANYNEIGCDKLNCWLKSSECSPELKHKYEQELLESAKKTLLSFSFFGLAEFENLSFYLFEKTFENKLKFSANHIKQRESLVEKLFSSNYSSYENEINENNHLDLKLYEFANTLFFERVNFFFIKNRFFSKP